MGCGKIISYHSESLKSELRAYIEDWEILSMKKNDQRTRTRFLEKYGGLSLYGIDFENRYSIDDKGINFLKGYVYDLIGNPNHTDGNSTDHEYFVFVMTCLTES